MRIVAGRHRGRRLEAPPGDATRPTADRLRQALFDMLSHAPWAGREVLDGAHVLDAFAGTGALGLEALSRGAAGVSFIERDRVALGVLRANITLLKEDALCRILAGDVMRPPRAGAPCDLVFLDPPYAQGLLPKALASLTAAGWIAPDAVICTELGREEDFAIPAGFEVLVERGHGAAKVVVLRPV